MLAEDLLERAGNLVAVLHRQVSGLMHEKVLLPLPLGRGYLMEKIIDGSLYAVCIFCFHKHGLIVVYK